MTWQNSTAWGLDSEPVDDWRDLAACRGEDPERWFPLSDTSAANQPQIEAAKAICRGCPVAADCLLWALDTGQQHGIWGGLTETERRPMLRAHKVQPIRVSETLAGCGSEMGYKRHQRNGTPPCSECRRAAAENERSRRARAARVA